MTPLRYFNGALTSHQRLVNYVLAPVTVDRVGMTGPLPDVAWRSGRTLLTNSCSENAGGVVDVICSSRIGVVH